LSRSDDLRVADIVEAARQLGELVAAGRETFDADWTRQRAAERLLEIIGEASNALSEDFKAKHPAVSWRHIINLRHLLAHHYHRVDMDQLWTIATDDIPQLLAELSTQ
jgi:uncharacterized protein with HEPN domain